MCGNKYQFHEFKILKYSLNSQFIIYCLETIIVSSLEIFIIQKLFLKHFMKIFENFVTPLVILSQINLYLMKEGV